MGGGDGEEGVGGRGSTGIIAEGRGRRVHYVHVAGAVLLVIHPTHHTTRGLISEESTRGCCGDEARWNLKVL